MKNNSFFFEGMGDQNVKKFDFIYHDLSKIKFSNKLLNKCFQLKLIYYTWLKIIYFSLKFHIFPSHAVTRLSGSSRGPLLHRRLAPNHPNTKPLRSRALGCNQHPWNALLISGRGGSVICWKFHSRAELWKMLSAVRVHDDFKLLLRWAFELYA